MPPSVLYRIESYQLPRPRNSARVIAKVSVLEQDASVLFMNADGVLDSLRFSSLVDERCVHVVDCTFAVASKCQRVGHVSATVLAKVERMFALMRVLWVAVRNNLGTVGYN